MVRFQSQRPVVRNYLNRKEQLRVLMLVGTLGLVIVMIGQAARPQNWYWLWGGKPPELAGQPAAETPMDTRRPDPNPAPAIGQFQSPADGGDTPAEPADDPAFTSAAPSEPAPALPALDEELRLLLEPVKDDSILRSVEHPAMFALFQRLQSSEPAVLKSQSVGQVTFRQLYLQPVSYRGQVVDLQGEIYGAYEIAAPKNELGIRTLFKVWFLPEDQAGLPFADRSPMVIYSLRLPESFGRGTKLHQPAQLTGYFFKRWTYANNGEIFDAPLVFAATVQPRVLTAVPTQVDVSPLPAVALVLLGLLATGGFFWVRSWAKPTKPLPDALALPADFAVPNKLDFSNVVDHSKNTVNADTTTLANESTDGAA